VQRGNLSGGERLVEGHPLGFAAADERLGDPAEGRPSVTEQALDNL